MGGSGKIPYPKHVWSPAGGWYGQPHNWKANTAIFGLIIAGLTAVAWRVSAEREVRYKMPEPDRFFPSRNWSRQIVEHEKVERNHKHHDLFKLGCIISMNGVRGDMKYTTNNCTLNEQNIV